MATICLYLHCHQPQRMKKLSVFDIGSKPSYFDEGKNRGYLERIARKSYLPTNALLLEMIKRTEGKFRVSLSITGVLIEQLSKEFPEVLKSFQDLVATGRCELVAETYYHSLASLYSKEEFEDQVEMQRKKFKEVFDYEPKFFRNTELVYDNEIGKLVEEMGFDGVLAEGADKILGWRSPNFVYKAKGSSAALLLRNYPLSDDISFRFSNRGWKEWPLTAEKYSGWINQMNNPEKGELINLFMDYETFGEHQWAETGIFDFLKEFILSTVRNGSSDFKTPSEVIRDSKPVAELDVPYPVSWADTERDLSAWLGNNMQQSAIEKIYSLGGQIRKTGNKELIGDWRKLQTSDHFYYMCTKWFADGDVHKYFNPHESPYESFISFMNIYNDLKIKVDNFDPNDHRNYKGLKVETN